MGAGGSGQAEAEEQEEHHEQGYVCVVVSTGEERGQKARGVWSPCKGRLLLIHIGFEQDGTPCLACITLNLPCRCNLISSEMTCSTDRECINLCAAVDFDSSQSAARVFAPHTNASDKEYRLQQT